MPLSRAMYTGKVLKKSARFGIGADMPDYALASFQLVTENQILPLYAIGMPAVALRRYIWAVDKLGADLSIAAELEFVFLPDNTILAYAVKIHWLVLPELMNIVEPKVGQDKKHLFGTVGLPPDWPKEVIFERKITDKGLPGQDHGGG